MLWREKEKRLLTHAFKIVAVYAAAAVIYSYIRTQFALNSDHFPVTARVGGDPLKGRISIKVDWLKFKKQTEKIGLDRAPISVGRVSFTREVQQALEENTTRVALGRRNHLGLSKEDKEIIRRKNKVKRAWNKHRREVDRIICRELEREVNDIVIEARRRKILQQLENTNPEKGDCWQLLRAMGKGVGIPDAPLRDGDRLVFNEKEKAELAASYFTEVFSNNRQTDRVLQNRADQVRDRLASFQGPGSEEGLPVVSVDRIVGLSKKKKKMKSALGEDGLSYRAFDNLHARAVGRLKDIFEASIRLGEVPSCWKAATVVLIPKKDKDPGRLANRRPISLINAPAKIWIKEEQCTGLVRSRIFYWKKNI